jgi:arylsulfatase A-like enzyme
MPARRELHTGRYNFLHRSWGPIEPYDVSMPEMLKQQGIFTHLISDHQHYWEDGGATYHNRYSSYEFVRGQEGDLWKCQVQDPEMLEGPGRFSRQDWVNRTYIREERDYPQAQTFELGMDFIQQNATEKNWFLQIETFDPHEPFWAPQKYRDLYPHEYSGPHFNWPQYRKIRETPEQVEHCRYEYAALLSMCDAYLGKILDLMDELDLWKDTLLIVSTDHGFLLGEHDWWAKCIQPFYNEVAHTPLFIWDPRRRQQQERRSSLVQTIDLAPTLLDYFNVPIPNDMLGISLRDTVNHDIPVRETALFGMHSGHINITDGRYVYMRAPENHDTQPAYNYTLMPTHMRSLFSPEELQAAKLSAPFRFAKGCPLLKIQAPEGAPGGEPTDPPKTMLFDLEDDPTQNRPIREFAVETYLAEQIREHLHINDAPSELYTRMGLG